jgi:OmpA-OmpF porin, OOP family
VPPSPPLPAAGAQVAAVTTPADVRLPGRVAIRFAIGSAAIPAAHQPQLDQVARLLIRDPALRARITGHTDQRGTSDENTVLSELRARSVGKALEAMGVASTRITTQAAGSLQPADPTDSAVAMARNRRAEIEIVREEAR